MKKKIIYNLLFLIILTGCSENDSDSEFIVGQWKVTARFEAGEPIDLGPCSESVIFEFNSDMSMRTFLINTDQIPPNVTCGTFPTGIYQWEKVENNNYKSVLFNVPTRITTYEVNGSTMSVNYLDSNRSAIYSRN